MKKLMITICTTVLVLSTMYLYVNVSKDNYVYSDNPFEIKNEEAKQKMESYLIMRDRSRNALNDDGKVLENYRFERKNYEK